MKYTKHYNPKQTPQSQPIPGRKKAMKKNSAGGFSFKVNEWDRLERFLILGSEGGSYYASERKLTLENAKKVPKLIQKDGLRVVKTVRDISFNGRAPKNDAALFVLALCASEGNEATKAEAFRVLPEVARIGTHLFQFVDAANSLRGWGRGLKRAVGNWYQGKDAEKLAYQLIKYQQRNKWSHRDVLRLAKPKPVDEAHRLLYKYVTKGEIEGEMPGIIQGFEEAKTAKNAKDVVKLISEYGLTREMIPTQFLTEVSVWDALLQGMPMTAMIRNLGNMSKVGLLAPLSKASKLVCERLKNQEFIQKSRIHPIQAMVALKTYKQGKGMKGSGVWTVNTKVADALDSTFYLSFKNVVPTGKNHMLAIDVSASMTWAGPAGMQGIDCRESAGAMAMITERAEENTLVTAFSSSYRGGLLRGGGIGISGDGIGVVDISSRKRLDDVIATINKMPAGGTDCSLPMVWALKNKVEIESFVVYTDSETWAGRIQPVQALKQYREKMGIPARLIVVGMVSNGFTIADPEDAGMMDVVGFDTAAPSIMADFVRDKEAVKIDG